MKSLNIYITSGIPGIIIGVVIALGIQSTFAWTTPPGAPATPNVDAPINVSANQQTKTGSLLLPLLYDLNNIGYYVDPNATSRLNYGVYDNMYSYGWTYSPIMYDTDSPSYYLDSNGTSRLNYGVFDNLYAYGWTYSPIMYDTNDAGYYVDPNATSRLNYGVFNNIHSYGTIGVGNYVDTGDVWLRNVGRWASQGALPDCRICANQSDSDGHWGGWQCSPYRTDGGGSTPIVLAGAAHGDRVPMLFSMDCR